MTVLNLVLTENEGLFICFDKPAREPSSGRAPDHAADSPPIYSSCRILLVPAAEPIRSAPYLMTCWFICLLYPSCLDGRAYSVLGWRASNSSFHPSGVPTIGHNMHSRLVTGIVTTSPQVRLMAVLSIFSLGDTRQQCPTPVLMAWIHLSLARTPR